VQQSSEEIESEDLAKSDELSARARNLYLRARDYGLRGLEAKHRSFAVQLREDPKSAVQTMNAGDVSLLYWTAVAWGAAISVAKDRADLVAAPGPLAALSRRRSIPGLTCGGSADEKVKRKTQF
jgi:hypothetical protein